MSADSDALLSSAFVAAHPDDAARILEREPPATAAALLAGFPPDAAAKVLRHMAPPRAAECVSSLPVEQSSAMIRALPLDVAVTILRRTPPRVQEAVLEGMAVNEREPIQRLLRYAEGTVGSLMDPMAFALPEDISVAEARRRIEESARDVRYYLYVVDRERKLVGVLNLRDLMLADASQMIADLMRRDVVRLPAKAELSEVLAGTIWRRFQALPVVDPKGAFLGVVTFDALRREDDSPAMQAGALFETALAMSELFWTGLTGMLGGLQAEAPTDKVRSPQSRRGRRGENRKET